MFMPGLECLERLIAAEFEYKVVWSIPLLSILSWFRLLLVTMRCNGLMGGSISEDSVLSVV